VDDDDVEGVIVVEAALDHALELGAGVVGGADEGEAAGGQDRPADVGPPGVLLTGRQGVGDAEVAAPGDLAGVEVDGRKVAPRRLLAEQAAGAVHEPVVARNDRAPDAVRPLHQLFDGAEVVGVDDVVAALGIVGAATPFHPAA